MKCPFCTSASNRVVDKRDVVGVGEIRRRRECLKCSKRFTTYERLASLELAVIKRDGRREPFSREKLSSGVIKALEKRPALSQANNLADKIERKLRRKGKRVVTSQLIGKMVLVELKKLDSVAYLRFASVYRNFGSADDFTKEASSLI